MQAADFLNDEDCLQQLFGRVSRALFPASGAQDSQFHVVKVPFFQRKVPAVFHLAGSD